MAAERGQEFEIRIAKAKDLPLSWFDLVLRPEKFQQHIKTLEDNPNIEPTGLQLVATFLEKGGSLEGQTPLSAPDSGEGTKKEVIEERRQRLVNCALFIGSFMQWDLALFEKSLPPAVSYSLLVQLTKYYPLTTSKTAVPSSSDSEQSSSHLLNESPSTLTAHVFYCHWVLRSLTLSHLPPDIRRSTNTWDVTCASPEQIKSLLDPQLSHCVNFLEEVCEHCSIYRIPSVSVSLPVMGRHGQGHETVELSIPNTGGDLPTSDIHCQIYYSLGCHYFWQDDFKQAHLHFKQCMHLLDSMSTCPSLVDPAQLKGFLCACVNVRGKESEGDETVEEDGDGKTLVERLEYCRINDQKHVPDQLIRDLSSPTILLSTCTALQGELARLAQDSQPQEPHPKRVKLDPSSHEPSHDISTSVPVHAQVAVCNAVRAVIDGVPIQPPFWKLVLTSEIDSPLYEFLFHVCHKAMDRKTTDSQRTVRLISFVRSVCSKSTHPEKVWDILLKSEAKTLASEKDTQLIRHLCSSNTSPPKSRPTTSSFTPFSSSPSLLLATHEKQILCATQCQELLSAVDECFKSVPTSEHKSLAMKWVGSGNEFINFDLISDPILLTKYNAMVHKAYQLKRAQCYTESVRFLRASLGLIPRPSALHGKSSGSHPKPDQVILDQILWVELKSAALEAKNLSSQEVAKRYNGLVEKTKSFCQRSYSLHSDKTDAMTVCLASAFLLNTHNYKPLASLEHPFAPGKVAPRLAIAALAVKEDRDARKSIRDVFSAVLSVFSTPVTTGSETRSEIDHKQLQLRSQFDVLVENLEDPSSLSLLLMALVRIWSIIKKPEEEIRMQTEHIMYWPTVIGSPASVNADHVFRALSSTLHHSLSIHPYNDSWMILQAEIHYATGKYGASLLCYLKAGAVTSRYFEDNVPSDIWPVQVYRKIITCCTHLNFHTHAVLFCQLLNPVDYELAFSLLTNHSSSMMESYFMYFWDMVIIEYLIYINAKRGDKYKQAIAVQIAAEPELNCNNSQEVLTRAAQVRRRKLLRSFYDQSYFTK